MIKLKIIKKKKKTSHHFQLFETPWTTACQAPLYMEFSRQEYLESERKWSCLVVSDSLRPHGL